MFKNCKDAPCTFKLLENKLPKLKLEMSPKHNFRHLVFCVRDSKAAKRCQICTRFTYLMRLLDNI